METAASSIDEANHGRLVLAFFLAVALIALTLVARNANDKAVA